MTKYLAWFSAGAASAVATKLALSMYDDVTIFRTDVGSEHPDNERFSAECAEWFGQEVRTIKVEKYVDTWDVWERTGYLVGPTGARCTVELKKGSSIPARSTIARQSRLVSPAMYQLGYTNNNCIGCVKGGMGYWNKIRRDFPETFDRMAGLERRLGHTVLRDEGEALFLDELDPDRGNHADEPDMDCSLLCAIAESDIEGGSNCGAAYGKNPDLCYLPSGHREAHSNKWGTTWAREGVA